MSTVLIARGQATVLRAAPVAASSAAGGQRTAYRAQPCSIPLWWRQEPAALRL